MAICPFAVWMPIPKSMLPTVGGHRVKKTAHNRINIHITAGIGNPFGFFSKPGNASSEFFINKAGTIFQFGDTEFKFEADFEGNSDTHSIENEGLHGPFTEAQVISNARLIHWLRQTHGIANKLATTSKPGYASHGLSWHRLGVDGNFPGLPSMLAGRKQRGGGLRYSRAYGKICPTDEVIRQIPHIFELSQDIGKEQHPTAPPPDNPKQPGVKPTMPWDKKNKYGRPLLVLDGHVGPVFVSELQRQLGTHVDGYISGQKANHGVFYNIAYSDAVATLQKRFDTPTDGKISYPKSSLVLAMQKHYGTPRDGQISFPKSSLVVALQSALNEGKL